MNKKLKLIIITLISSLLFIPKLFAASGSMSVYASKTSAIVGDTITVTVTAKVPSGIGGWDFNISYDSSKLKYVGGDEIHKVGQLSYAGQTSQSFTYKFKVIAKGTSTVTTNPAVLYDINEQLVSLTKGSTKITAITQAELEASYSKNNNLSSLGVEGYTLEFNKDTLEYSLSVPSSVTKVNITGAVEDGTASVTGLGEVDVSEGENTFSIVVTAQNGSTKTYTLKINVQDDNPIEVTVDGVKYTLIKRANSFEIPTNYTETTVTIKETEIPAFTSEITKYILVGLKNEAGEKGLFLYDEKSNTYTKYIELKTNSLLIFPKTASEIPEGYTKTKLIINEQEIEAYKYKNSNGFYLIYGVNLETNEEGFYQYDEENSTVIKYNDEIIKSLNNRLDNYMKIIIVLGLETLVLVMILIISITKKNKRNKKLNKLAKELKEKANTPKEETKEIEEPKIEKEETKDKTKK